MPTMEPFVQLENDVADLERMVPEIERAALDLDASAVREEALAIIGRLRTALATVETVLAVVLPDGVNDLIDDPERLLRRVRARLGEEVDVVPPGPR